MTDSFEDIMEILRKEKEEYDFQQTVKKVYSRPKKSKLTKSVKMAGKRSPGSLECFKDEFRTYSDKEVRTYLDGTSYFESYNAMRSQDDY